MWDSAGLERYRALIPSYVRGASIIFIVYDVSSRESFNNLITWINFIKQVNTDNAMLILCGNKIDLDRKVSIEEGKKLAVKEKMVFYEVSARTGENVNKMMYSCIAELPFFEQYQTGTKESLINELEANNIKEQNSIYDIVKEDSKNKKNNDYESKEENQNQNNNNNNSPPPNIILIKPKKKKGCCS
jgi:GTPase SAR1 family protein